MSLRPAESPQRLTLSGVETAAIGRRSFLVGAGRGALGLAVLGLAGCTADEATGEERGSASGLDWSRVDLAYVSAYVLVRGREAVLVDTGLSDSADEIGQALETAGSGWDRVRAVVVTHAHFDHILGLPAVAERAARARLYAGALDIEAALSEMPSWPRQLAPERRLHAVGDGDEVFGLQVVATPGHTPGHVAVFDTDSGLLVAGDALTNTVDGHLGGSLRDVTYDKSAAADSVRKMAALRPQVILVGHGPPVERQAAAQLRSLARSMD